MTQTERRRLLVDGLAREQGREIPFPKEEEQQRRLLRTLLNIRPPLPAGEAWLAVQDAYLQEELRRRGVTRPEELEPVEDQLFLWQGDITTLAADAVVNAANSALLGCFLPCHACIDNTIHTYAGVQLRLACARLMEAQGRPEPAGRAKITPAFNLPSRWVLHTVGPIITGRPTAEDAALLASCYRSCLQLAEREGARSVAFCCISTGEFHYPAEQAALIAVGTVQEYLRQAHCSLQVIFNVYKDSDLALYRRLLPGA